MPDLHPGDGGEHNNLKAYWLFGPGSMKILWSAPGDWTRCEHYLEKHVGPERAKRFCAQWHHDRTGMWPGDHRNR